jgi:SpoVK/Ycf46/Vps4 family AAA+-type ATPase
LQDRFDCLKSLTKTLSLAADVNLADLTEATPGYLGADLKALVDHAVHTALARHVYQVSILSIPFLPIVFVPFYQTSDLTVRLEDFDGALHAIVPSTQRYSDVTVDLKPMFWKDIGGLSDVKCQIKQARGKLTQSAYKYHCLFHFYCTCQAVEWPLKFPKAFQRLGIPCPKGVLLYGPPGCAKTTLVRAAATSCHITFLAVSCAQLYSPFVGDSEKKIAEVSLTSIINDQKFWITRRHH